MPKIVDHAQRRDEIALVACRVVAEHGFDGASMVRIARAPVTPPACWRTTSITKQDIIIAALRLILRRIDERLARPAAPTAEPDLLALLTEALPVDEHRRTECAFWTSSGDRSAPTSASSASTPGCTAILRLFERCLAQCWPEWSAVVSRQARNRCCARWSPSSTDSPPAR